MTPRAHTCANGCRSCIEITSPYHEDEDGYETLGENVKNYGLFFVVFMAVGAGVVAANTYNDGSVGVDFQAYDSPDQAVTAAIKASDSGYLTAEVVLEAPEP
jgi:hypothetical protein